MLAVVSLALVSCGGGGSKVELAYPAVLYQHAYWDSEVDVEISVKSFELKASEDDKFINVSAKIELISTDFKDIDEVKIGIQLLDENENVVVKRCCDYLKITRVGEVGVLKVKINPSESLTASQTLKKVKYVRFYDVLGRK